MRVLIVTAGSHGDVAPCTGLGQRLRQAGHEVALAAHDRFAALAGDAGLEHRSLPGDPAELGEALRTCLTAASYHDSAVSLARRVRADDGSAAVLEILRRFAHPS